MKNAITDDSSGKPDASKVARPAWGWGWAVTPALHHSGYPECKNVYPDVDGKPDYSVQTKKEKKK